MKLQVKTPGQSFEFSPRDGVSSFVVGKRKEDDLTIEDDPEISAPHVRIDRFADNWSFTDQFSDSGTFHNGEKKYSNDLKSGDVLKIGQTELTVVDVDAPPRNDFSVKSDFKFDSPGFDDSVSKDDAEVEDEEDDALQPLSPPPARAEAKDDYKLIDIARLAKAEAAEDLEDHDVPEVFVDRIAHRLLVTFANEHGSVRLDRAASDRLREAARKAVIELESVKRTTVDLPFLVADKDGPKHLRVDVERKHLHDEFGPKLPPERELRRPPPVGSRTKPPGANPNKPKVVAIATGIAIFAIIFGINFVFSSDFGDSGEAPPEPAPLCGGAADLEDAEEDELLATVKALRTDEETQPQKLLDRLDAIESLARAKGYTIGWDYESARTIIETRVYSDVSTRYGDVSRSIGDLQRDEKYREAQEMLDSFQTFLDSSPHNERAITTIRIPQSMERWQETNQRESSELVAESLLVHGEALSRNDYAVALAAAERMHKSAMLGDAVLEALAREVERLQRESDSAEGEPTKAFDRRTDELPETPRNVLFPSGDTTGWQYHRRIKWEFEKALRAGELDGKEFEIWGVTARIEGDPKSSLVYLHYSRELVPGIIVEGTDRTNLPNAHPKLEVNVQLLWDGLNRERLLGLLVDAFHNGLMEEAGEIAYRIRLADESAREPLDEILAAKWGVEVPEGGFPERDGRVVPE